MLILITNDDGVHAPGIRALAAALAPLGDVQVVAPDREVSSCSQSLTLKNPLRVENLEPGVYSVDGTPADCVNIACVKILKQRPDVVVSGINRGGNLGDDVFYSGTVGGTGGPLAWSDMAGALTNPTALSTGMVQPLGLHRARMRNVIAVADESATDTGAIFVLETR